jgi:hypothetical protein
MDNRRILVVKVHAFVPDTARQPLPQPSGPPICVTRTLYDCVIDTSVPYKPVRYVDQ